MNIPSILDGTFTPRKMTGFVANLDEWTEAEDAFVRKWWGKAKAVKIAAHLRRSVSACQERAQLMDLRSDLPKRAAQERFLGNDFYRSILAEFASDPCSTIANRHGVKLATAKNWVSRAQKYAREGRF